MDSENKNDKPTRADSPSSMPKPSSTSHTQSPLPFLMDRSPDTSSFSRQKLASFNIQPSFQSERKPSNPVLQSPAKFTSAVKEGNQEETGSKEKALTGGEPVSHLYEASSSSQKKHEPSSSLHPSCNHHQTGKLSKGKELVDKDALVSFSKGKSRADKSPIPNAQTLPQKEPEEPEEADEKDNANTQEEAQSKSTKKRVSGTKAKGPRKSVSKSRTSSSAKKSRTEAEGEEVKEGDGDKIEPEEGPRRSSRKITKANTVKQTVQDAQDNLKRGQEKQRSGRRTKSSAGKSKSPSQGGKKKVVQTKKAKVAPASARSKSTKSAPRSKSKSNESTQSKSRTKSPVRGGKGKKGGAKEAASTGGRVHRTKTTKDTIEEAELILKPKNKRGRKGKGKGGRSPSAVKSRGRSASASKKDGKGGKGGKGKGGKGGKGKGGRKGHGSAVKRTRTKKQTIDDATKILGGPKSVIGKRGRRDLQEDDARDEELGDALEKKQVVN